MIKIVAAVLFLISTGPALAEGVTDCNAALVITKTATSTSLSQKLAILQSVTKHDFEEARQKLAGSGTAYIDGMIFSGDMNWEDFQKQVHDFTSNYKYDLDLQYAYRYNNAYLPTTSSDAYQACLKSQRPIGTHLWVDGHGSPKSEIVTIHLVFNTPVSAGTPMRAYIDYFGGRPLIKPDQWERLNKFSGSLDEQIYFQRDSIDKEAGFKAIVPAANQAQSDFVSLPARLRIKKRALETKIVETSGQYQSNGSAATSGTFCFPNKNEDSELLNSGYTITAAQSRAEPTDGRSTEGINPASVTPTRACAAFVVNGDAPATGHGAIMHISVNLQRERWVDVTDDQ